MIKNAKVKVNHLGHWRKSRDLGPRSDDPYSAFEIEGNMLINITCDVWMSHYSTQCLFFVGKMYTVAQYFEMQGKKFPATYGKHLKKGKLQYPALPTINIGSNTKPIFVPPELVSVPGGQSRTSVRIQTFSG